MALTKIAPGDSGFVVRGKLDATMNAVDAAVVRGNAHEIAIANLQANTNALAADKAPLAFVTSTYNPLLTSQNDLLRPGNRPGDAPRLFTAALGGPIDALAPLSSAAALTTARGRVFPMFGAGFVASREYVAIEPNRVYALDAAIERYQAVDPAGDMVRPGVAFLNANYGVIGFVGFFDWDLATGQYATGTKKFALAAGTGIDVVAPAGTVYAQRAVQVFGGPQRTDLIHLGITDVTGQLSWSPDLSSVEGRLAAQEAIEAEDRLAALESAADEPKSASFNTQLAAETNAISASSEIALFRGYKVAGDLGRLAIAYRVDEDPGAQWGFQDGDGAFWRFSEDRGPMVIGEEYLAGLMNHINLGQSDGVGIQWHRFGDSTGAGLYDGGLDPLLREMLDRLGLAHVSLHSHEVGGTGVPNADVSLLSTGPGVVTVKYSINDEAFGLPLHEEHLNTLISDIRADFTFAQLPIVIISGNSTDDAATGRDWTWHKSLRAMYERLSRSRKVTFIDVFGIMPDSKALAGITMDDPAIHPYVTQQVQLWGHIVTAIFGSGAKTAWRADNTHRNIPFHREPFDDAKPPSYYKFGRTTQRVVAGDINGKVETTMSRDGVVNQLKTGFRAGSSHPTQRFRTNVDGSTWSTWSGEPVAVTLSNGWTDYGGGVAPSSVLRNAEGEVTLHLEIKSGAVVAGTTVATLPAGMRPAATLFLATQGASLEIGRARISPDGTIKIESGSWSTVLTTLDARFKAA